MSATIIKNGLIVTAVDSFSADLLVQNGQVAQIEPDLDYTGIEVIDATGKLILPGGVDVHTHVNLTAGGVKVADGWFMGTAAAACGGTTCIVEHPGFGPAGCRLGHQIEVYRQEAAERAVVDYSLHGVFQYVDRQVLDDIELLMNQGVPSAKIYTTYDGRLKDADILLVLKRMRQVGGLTAFHAESEAIIKHFRRIFSSQGKLAPIYHARSRPDYCEAEAIHRILALARAAEAPVYVVHLSTALGLAEIRGAQKRGQRVWAEVCPQHLLLDESCYLEKDNGGLKYIMAPPARRESDREALWQGLIDGTIQVVATDHCSFNLSDKIRLGSHDFRKCPGGLPGLETRLPLLYSEGVRKGRISLERFVEVTSTAPARIMGLYPRKGCLAPGSDADLVIFDPTVERVISPENLYHDADYSPYHGRSVFGWPVLTMVRGRVVMKNGRLLAEKGWGDYIERHLENQSV